MELICKQVFVRRPGQRRQSREIKHSIFSLIKMHIVHGMSTLHQKCRLWIHLRNNDKNYVNTWSHTKNPQGGSVIYEAGEVAVVWPVAGVYPTNK